MRRYIYLASSWRNEHQPRIVNLLRDAGHQVYDFRNPQRPPTEQTECLVVSGVALHDWWGIE